MRPLPACIPRQLAHVRGEPFLPLERVPGRWLKVVKRWSYAREPDYTRIRRRRARSSLAGETGRGAIFGSTYVTPWPSFRPAASRASTAIVRQASQNTQ